MILAFNLVVVMIAIVALLLALQESVARSNARMVDESALKYTGAKTREELVNRRAHVNRDPRFAQNPANTGFIFFYDCRDTDLAIEGVLPPCKFFGISVYDRFSMPLPSMAIDDDVRDGDGRFVVFLTTRPSGARNEIDVSSHPRGTGILRYSHMERPETIDQLEPNLVTVPRAGRMPERG